MTDPPYKILKNFLVKKTFNSSLLEVFVFIGKGLS